MTRNHFVSMISLFAILLIGFNVFRACQPYSRENMETDDFVSQEQNSDSIEALAKYKSDSIRSQALQKFDLMKKSFELEKDEFEGITFYTHKKLKIKHGQSGMRMYVGASGKSVWMRAIVKYGGNDWLFMQSMKIKYGDTIKAYNLSLEPIVRDHSDGIVWEVVDILVEKHWRSVFLDLSKQQNANIRLIGTEKIHDFSISQAQLAAMEQTIQLHDLLVSLQ